MKKSSNHTSEIDDALKGKRDSTHPKLRRESIPIGLLGTLDMFRVPKVPVVGEPEFDTSYSRVHGREEVALNLVAASGHCVSKLIPNRLSILEPRIDTLHPHGFVLPGLHL